MIKLHDLRNTLILMMTTLCLASCGTMQSLRSPKPPPPVAAAGVVPAASVQRVTVFSRAPSGDEIADYIRKMTPQQRSSSIKLACGRLRPWEPGYKERLLTATTELPKGHVLRQATVDLIDARCANEICRGEISQMCRPIADRVGVSS